MKNSFKLIVCALVYFGLTANATNAQVEAPSGWAVEREGQTSLVSNGNATVTVGPWQSLNGQSVQAWLESFRNQNPKGGQVTSSEPIKAEKVNNAFSMIRRAQFGRQEGIAVLYACPGRPGEARLMALDVKNGGFWELTKGALYGEKLCTAQIASLKKGGKRDVAASKATPAPAKTIAPVRDMAELARLNSAIPDALRPTQAELYTDWVLRGFPAMLTLKLEMVLTFPGGTKLACSDWVIDKSVSLVKLAREESCKPSRGDESEALQRFEPGQTIDVKFGNLSGSSIDGLEGSAHAMSGGDLVMTRNGEIALGRWGVVQHNANAGNISATSTRKSGIFGRYYTEGNTITIATNKGEVLHGFIGYSFDKGGDIDTVYLNGKWYRDLTD